MKSIAATAAAASLWMSIDAAWATWDYGGGPGRFGSAAAACQEMLKQSSDRYKFSSVKPTDIEIPKTYGCFATIEGGDGPFYVGAVVEAISGTLESTDSVPASQEEGATSKSNDSMPWSKARIAAIAKKSIYVGVHMTITVKQGAALDGLGGHGAFAQLSGNDKQIAALGNGGVVGLLPPVQVKAGQQPSAGYILKPTDSGSSSIELVAWNTGSPIQDYNASHAEHQLYDYITGRGAWLSKVATIQIDVFGLDICAQCNVDLQHLQAIILERNPDAVVTYQRAD